MNAILPARLPDGHRPPETDDERRVRHLETLREMAELGMAMARNAAAESIDNSDPEPRPAKTADPALAFARATRAVRQAIALETRIAANDLVPARRRPTYTARGQTPDPRRALLRQSLHKAVDAEPDRAARTELRREIDECIEHDLREDPAGAIPACDIFVAICENLGLRIDPSRLPAELLGLAPPSTPAAAHAAASPGRYHRRE